MGFLHTLSSPDGPPRLRRFERLDVTLAPDVMVFGLGNDHSLAQFGSGIMGPGLRRDDVKRFAFLV
jgi:hypothetical protein